MATGTGTGKPYVGPKKIRFRAKVSRSGDKYQIIIPTPYHPEIKRDFHGKYVEVSIEEILPD